MWSFTTGLLDLPLILVELSELESPQPSFQIYVVVFFFPGPILQRSAPIYVENRLQDSEMTKELLHLSHPYPN